MCGEGEESRKEEPLCADVPIERAVSYLALSCFLDLANNSVARQVCQLPVIQARRLDNLLYCFLLSSPSSGVLVC
jgi:hypothetical protein